MRSTRIEPKVVNLHSKLSYPTLNWPRHLTWEINSRGATPTSEPRLERWRATSQPIVMFLSHYPKVEREPLVGGWARGYEAHGYAEIEEECTEFARRVAGSAVEDMGWLDDEQ